MLFLLSSYFPQQYLRRPFSCRELTQNMFCLRSCKRGLSVIYSLNRAFVLAGKKISEVPGWDRVSVILWAWRRHSRSPRGENSWEENNVSMWMPVKCVSWWESMFSVKSRHNKQWLKPYEHDYDTKKNENIIPFTFNFILEYEIQEEYLNSS